MVVVDIELADYIVGVVDIVDLAEEVAADIVRVHDDIADFAEYVGC